MASINNLEEGDTGGVLTLIIIGALGFYVALVLVEAITITVDTILPDARDPVIKAWINFIVAIILVSLLVYIFVCVFSNRKRKRECFC
jgi:nucleoside recognition membrane protein YjiH